MQNKILFKYGVTFLSILTIGSSTVVPISSTHANSNIEQQSIENISNDSLQINSQNIDSVKDMINNEMNKLDIPKEYQNQARQQMLDFYNPNNENYLNLDSLTAWNNDDDVLFKSSHGTISVKVLGSILDVSIASVVTGGVGAINNLIKKKGKVWVKNQISSKLVSILASIGIVVGAKSIEKAIEFGLDLTSPGEGIANYLDSIDNKRNNNYIEWS